MTYLISVFSVYTNLETLSSCARLHWCFPLCGHPSSSRMPRSCTLVPPHTSSERSATLCIQTAWHSVLCWIYCLFSLYLYFLNALFISTRHLHNNQEPVPVSSWLTDTGSQVNNIKFCVLLFLSWCHCFVRARRHSASKCPWILHKLRRFGKRGADETCVPLPKW